MKRMNIARAGLAAAALAAVLACGSLALAGETEPTEISADDIQSYCGTCHFTNIENASINSWNSTNVDAAMVESMVPQLDDETIEGIAAYFAQIEPSEQDGEQG